MTLWKQLTKELFECKDDGIQGLAHENGSFKRICNYLAEHNVIANKPVLIPTYQQWCDYLFFLDGGNLKYMLTGQPNPFYWREDRHQVKVTEFSKTISLTGAIINE